MSESTQARLDVLKAALLDMGVATVCSKATDSQGRPLIEMNLKTGEFKLGGFSLGSLPSDPQMITVTVGEWPESDLPRNAIERAAFLGDQVMKVPAEHRESAELSTEDVSFDRDGSDIRTALTYRRRETAEEAAERVARQSGSSIVISNKTNGDITVISNGRVVARFGCLEEEDPVNAVTQSFVVQGSQVFLPESTVAQAELRTATTKQGKRVAAGIGLGSALQSAEDLCKAVAANIAPPNFKITDPADQIRQVIRDELKPGGMLHRG